MHATPLAANSAAPFPLDRAAARKRVALEETALQGIILALRANGLPTDGPQVEPYKAAWREAKNAEAALVVAETTATEPAAQAAKHRACDERCVKAKSPASTCSCECNGANHGKGANATPSADEPAQTELAVIEEVRAYSWGLKSLQAFAKRHRKHRITISLCNERGRPEGVLEGPEITGAWMLGQLRRSYACQYLPQGYIARITAYAVAA